MKSQSRSLGRQPKKLFALLVVVALLALASGVLGRDMDCSPWDSEEFGTVPGTRAGDHGTLDDNTGECDGGGACMLEDFGGRATCLQRGM